MLSTSRKSGEKWGPPRAEGVSENLSKEEKTMSSKIDPEAAQPSTVQSFELSDRNPVVTEWGDAGGPVASPSAGEQRVTPEGPAVSPDTGLKY